jgi:DUF4097 and DUF4098 domain-containing protein YvlB
MRDRIETFEVRESVRVVAGTRSGDIRVVTGPPGTVTVALDGSSASSYLVDQVGDVITVESRKRGLITGSVDVLLTVPGTATLELSCTSGDIEVQGEVQEMRASVASGDVRADTVRTMCHVNSASGDITVGTMRDAEINTASGTVRLGRVERNLRLNAASGDVYVDEVGESARSKVASSTMRIAVFRGSEVRHKAMSGDLYLGIPPRRTVELDLTTLSGRLRNRLEKGDGSPSEKLLVISVNAVSGDLNLHSVAN